MEKRENEDEAKATRERPKLESLEEEEKVESTDEGVAEAVIVES